MSVGRTTLIGMLLAATLTACGSTVQSTGDAVVAGGTQAGDGLGAPASGSTGGTTEGGVLGAGGSGGDGTAAAGSDAQGTTGSGSTSSGGAPAVAGSPSGSGGAGSSGTAASAPRGGKVEVGVYVVDNADAFYKAVGVDNSFGDNRKQATAVIEAVNASGGLAGRTVVPVFGSVDPTSSEGAATQEQRLCSLWTQDHKVVAAIVIVRVGVLADCLAEKGVPMLVVAPENFTDGQFARWSTTAAPASVSHEQGVRLLVSRAAAQGYFRPTAEDLAPQVVLGYLYYETPEQKRVATKVFEPLAQGQGVKKIVPVGIKYPNSASEGSESISQIQNSVLKFRSEGVTHVIILDNGGNLTFNFPQAAESQNYRPRYAWNTFNAIGLEQQYVPTSQLRRSVGVGWQPVYDVAAGQAPKPAAAAERCLGLMSKAGQNPAWGSARSKSYAYCDMLFHLQAAAAQAPDLSGASLIGALQATGTRLPTAQTFTSRYGPGRRFGAGSARDLFFDDSCSCILYRGSLQPVP